MLPGNPSEESYYDYWRASEASETLSGLFSLGCSMIKRAVYMVESVRTYVSNTHARVRMSVCYLDRNVS